MNQAARPGKVKAAFALLVVLMGLCGCAHQYLMKFSNGDQMISASKPKLQDGTYHYTDDSGGRYVIPKSRVVEIRAVSVERAEEQPAPPQHPVQPKQPKHWYFLWLA